MNQTTDIEKTLIQTKELEKFFSENKENRTIFANLNFSCHAGESISLIGPSGSGKSTLLHIFGLLDLPSKGSLFFKGEDSLKWSAKKRSSYRARSMGFVFQKHFLLAELSLRENISLPLLRLGLSSAEINKKTNILLEKMELTHRAEAKPKFLSGGELQRGAICRAIIHEPELLLMDEPTGSLDPERGKMVISDILKMLKPNNTACIIVTHNMEFAKQTDSSYQLIDARLKRYHP